MLNNVTVEEIGESQLWSVVLPCSMDKRIFKWKEDFSMDIWIVNFISLKPEAQDNWRWELEKWEEYNTSHFLCSNKSGLCCFSWKILVAFCTTSWLSLGKLCLIVSAESSTKKRGNLFGNSNSYIASSVKQLTNLQNIFILWNLMQVCF